MNNKYLIIGLLTFIVSCVPENDFDNPLAYRDYISISSDQYPAVSPDGKWIAYYHKSLEYPESIEYPTGLYLMNEQGNNRRLLITGSCSQPDWSPDGKWIAFSNYGTIQIINFEGDSLRTLQNEKDLPCYYPDWSENGLKIIYTSPLEGGGGFVYNIENMSSKQFFNFYEFNAYPIKWIGNNNYLCVSILNDWKFEEIVITDTTFSNQKRLTKNNVSDRDPAISPDREYIAWSNNMQIHIIKVDGSNKRRIDYGACPAWTHDGKSIIYSFKNDESTKEVLFKIDINAKNKIQLTF